MYFFVKKIMALYETASLDPNIMLDIGVISGNEHIFW